MEIRLVITSTLLVLPSIIWLLMKQVQSPWWLENISATSFTILPIYCVLMLVLVSFLSIGQCFSYLLVNFIFALYLNNSVSINDEACDKNISVFQFNIKYQEGENELNSLVEYLVAENYHLIALQGVSQRSKQLLVKKLSPYFPHFISGGSAQQQVHSDQLLFSRYGFTHINYVKNDHSAYLITSQWKLPFTEINLHSLHPPSPRNEKLWQTRNKTLYQLKYALNQVAEDMSANISSEKNTLEKSSLVIGDLNLSKHSNRINNLKQDMNTRFVNSWPNKPYIPMLFGLAIDQLWVSNSASICTRERINQFTWSDHYAIKTYLNFIE